MENNDRKDVSSAITTASSVGTMAFLGLAALTSELRASGAVGADAVERISTFMLRSLDRGDASAEAKELLRKLVAMHFS